MRTAVGSCGIHGLGCGVGLAKALADLHWGECGSCRERGQVSKWFQALGRKQRSDDALWYVVWYAAAACVPGAGGTDGHAGTMLFANIRIDVVSCRVAVRLLRGGGKGRKLLLRVRMVKRGESAVVFLMDSEKQDCGRRLKARQR